MAEITKYGIAKDGSNVSAHFGRCPEYQIVEISDRKLVSSKVVDNPGHSPGAIPEFMHSLGVNVMVAGGMGHRAIAIFQSHGIEVKLGIQGVIEDVIEGLKNDTLDDGDSLCSPRSGKGYGLDKEHDDDHPHHHN